FTGALVRNRGPEQRNGRENELHPQERPEHRLVEPLEWGARWKSLASAGLFRFRDLGTRTPRICLRWPDARPRAISLSCRKPRSSRLWPRRWSRREVARG